MTRSQIQNQAPEADSINLQASTEREESKRQTYQDSQQNGHSTKPNGLVEVDQLEDQLEPAGHQNGPTLDHPATTASAKHVDSGDVKGEPPKQGSKGRRKWVLLIIGVIVLASGSMFGLRWWKFQNTHVSTDNAQIKGHLSPISAKVPATVKQVLVNDGDYVTAGQTLLILEDQDLNLKVRQAEAKLTEAQAALKSARDTVSVTSQTNPTQVQQAQSTLAAKSATVSAAQATVNQAQAKVDANQASVAQAQTAVNTTGADFRRYQLLYEKGAVSAQQLDTVRAAYENAQASLTTANKTVAQAQAEVRNAQAQLQSAQAEVATAQGQVAEKQVDGQTVTIQKDQQQQAAAQVKQAQAELALARQQIAYTVIKAPISGYVGQITAQVGQKVQADQPLLSVVPLQTEDVYVDANFRETALGKLELGEKAEIEVDAYPGQTFQATIAGISPATGSSFALIPPDNASGNFNKVVQWVPVRLVFDAHTDPQHRLRPGLSVKVTVDTASGTSSAATQPSH